jgi:hypothetical protein
MFRNRLRAFATALVLGTAVVAVAGVATTVPAEAGVKPAVGNALRAAQSLASSGNYSAAMAKIREAEGAATTPEERSTVARMRQYVSAKAGGGSDSSSAYGARAKLVNDYRAGRYRAVIQDQDALRRYGALDGQSMRVIAQAYYQLGDYSGCLRYIKNNLGLGGAATLAMTCAAEAGDMDAVRDLSRELVLSSPTPENWARLLSSAERTKGLGDHETLDLYRLKKLTGNLKTADDYALLTQLALNSGSAAEGFTVVQAGFQAKVMTEQRYGRLFNTAKGAAGQAAAKFGTNLASAKAEKRGDDLLRLGEYIVGAGKAADGVAIIQQAIAKGTGDPGGAKLRLGYAQLMAGQKDAAIRTFKSIQDTENEKTIAGIWAIYASTAK